jgi:hypothetical protein
VVESVVSTRACTGEDASVVSVPALGVDANGQRAVCGQGGLQSIFILAAARAALTWWHCVLVVGHLDNRSRALARTAAAGLTGVRVVVFGVEATRAFHIVESCGQVATVASCIGLVARDNAEVKAPEMPNLWTGTHQPQCPRLPRRPSKTHIAPGP